jgi:hypothetical protein
MHFEANISTPPLKKEIRSKLAAKGHSFVNPPTKASYGMGLKSTQAWGCLFKDMSALTPSIPPPPSPFSYLMFWKLSDRYKCA